MINLKDKNLTKVSLFKNNFCKSWAYLPLTGQVVIHDEDSVATNWNKYIIHNQVAGAVGDGYQVDRYKEQKELKEPLYSKLIKQFLNNKH